MELLSKQVHVSVARPCPDSAAPIACAAIAARMIPKPESPRVDVPGMPAHAASIVVTPWVPG